VLQAEVPNLAAGVATAQEADVLIGMHGGWCGGWTLVVLVLLWRMQLVCAFALLPLTWHYCCWC
jgi:hypothetical protein